jgi:ribosomal-protein-alanine N-acetyltransferase
MESACFPADAWSASSLSSHLSSPDNYAILLLEADEPVGYVTGRLFAPEGELYRIAILPSHRKKGLGKTLLSQFFTDARARGCEQIFLEVRESNTPARTLYESFGMQVTGRRKGYYQQPKEDAILYTI